MLKWILIGRRKPGPFAEDSVMRTVLADWIADFHHRIATFLLHELFARVEFGPTALRGRC
jgi:hypothetical protein